MHTCTCPEFLRDAGRSPVGGPGPSSISHTHTHTSCSLVDDTVLLCWWPGHLNPQDQPQSWPAVKTQTLRIPSILRPPPPHTHSCGHGAQTQGTEGQRGPNKNMPHPKQRWIYRGGGGGVSPPPQKELWAIVCVHKRQSVQSAERRKAHQWPVRPQVPFCHKE